MSKVRCNKSTLTFLDEMNKMKKILVTAFLAAICISARAEEQPKSAPPRIISNKHIWPNFDFVEHDVLSIQTDKAVVAGGDPVLIYMLVKNNTKKTFSIQEAITDRDYEYIVEKVIKGKDGKITLTPANLTEWGTQVVNGPWAFFRFFYRDLKPGDTEQDQIIISRLFDMTMPGTYSIKVNCYAIQRDDAGVKTIKLESEALQLEVQ